MGGQSVEILSDFDFSAAVGIHFLPTYVLFCLLLEFYVDVQVFTTEIFIWRQQNETETAVLCTGESSRGGNQSESYLDAFQKMSYKV